MARPPVFPAEEKVRIVLSILAGEMTVLLPGAKEWQKVKGGEAFDVPAKSAFSLRVTGLADYCCSFLA